MAEKSLGDLISAIKNYEHVDSDTAKTAADVLNGCLQFLQESIFTIDVTLWSKGILKRKGDFLEIYAPLLVQILDEIGDDYLGDNRLQSVIRKQLPGADYLLEKNKEIEVSEADALRRIDEECIIEFGEVLLNVRKSSLQQRVEMLSSKCPDFGTTFDEMFRTYVNKALENEYQKELMNFLLKKKENPLKNLLRLKGYANDIREFNMPESDALRAYYFAFSNRLIYSVEKALEGMDEYRTAKGEGSKIDVIRHIISDSDAMNRFMKNAPLSLDIGFTDDKGVFAPRQRMSAIFLLEFYSRVKGKKWFFPEGEIRLWESHNAKIWVLGSASEQLLYDYIDSKKDWYVLNFEDVLINDFKMLNAVRTVFNNKIYSANNAYMKKRLHLDERQMRRLYLLAEITDNDTSMIPLDASTKKKRIFSHLDVLEDIISNAGLTSGESDIMEGWTYAQGEGVESKAHLKRNIRASASLARSKIKVSLIRTYHSHLEEEFDVSEVELEEQQRVEEGLPIIIDNKYRIRLAYRIKQSMKEEDLSYRDIIRSSPKKLNHVTAYTKMLFNNSWKDMFSFVKLC